MWGGGGSPDAGGQAGVRGVALLLLGLAEVGEAAAHHRLALVEHQVQPVVGQLDEDEEDGDGGAVDAQCHGGGRQGLQQGERRGEERRGEERRGEERRGEEMYYIQIRIKVCLIQCFKLHHSAPDGTVSSLIVCK